MAHSPLDHVIDHPLFTGSPVSKYQFLLVAAAGLIAIAYIPLARRVEDGTPPRGPLWNFLEMLLIFIRDEVARPSIPDGHSHGHDDHHHAADGHHDHYSDGAESATDFVKKELSGKPHEATYHPHRTADRFVPFLWTLFLFILTCNLLGMVPFLGSPTADLGVTAALAGITFFVIHGSAIRKLGIGGYVRSYIPTLRGDNLLMNLFLVGIITPLITAIEVLGALIRGAVLAIRLFANLYAGHFALAVILGLAVTAKGELSLSGGATAFLLGTALSVLELFVAFLQAFVFTLLTSIFLGMQLNPEH
jgi:F-type H+-transporting ATPase subunit a